VSCYDDCACLNDCRFVAGALGNYQAAGEVQQQGV